MNNEQISFIPLGGVSNVTKNMYLYEYKDEVLIVDCGIGFADETMLGVDLLLPDISYLLQNKKKIVGMVLTHGHEDHIGALPFVLPQLPQFPLFATPLTAALANEKLKEFEVPNRVKPVEFGGGKLVLGSFSLSFIRVTHSVPDTSHIFIRTPVGNFYHGSDFKFDLTPADNKKIEFDKIVAVGKEGVLCLMSDCLRSEKEGYTPSERELGENFEREIAKAKGKVIITTYSSNISRLNQAIKAAQKFGRKICFVGRSFYKVRDVAVDLGYMKIDKGSEISVEQLKNYKDSQVVLIVAGSQGQENSALSRIANGDSKEIKINPDDVVIFSSDPIPGNEISVNNVIDSISKKGARVVYSEISSDFHVSGHAASNDLMLLMSLLNPKKVLPIGGTFRQMVAYKGLAKRQGFEDGDILLTDDGQEIIFTKDSSSFGKKVTLKKVYVDQMSGEEVEHFVLIDRQKIAENGVVIVMAEIDSETGKMVNSPTIIARGFSSQESAALNKTLANELRNKFSIKTERVNDWIYVRKVIAEIAERNIFKALRKHPLVLPVVIEV
ncbi:MAG: ribonuclease J [Patescibacteria group bacterium]|nr:ribonuclease J [Patescibacteria group bacterium]